MKLLDVFGKCNGYKRLRFEDFEPLGWTYNDYFRYMSFCDEIRSAIIISDYVGKIEGMIMSDRQMAERSLVNQRMKALFAWLQQFNDEPLPEPAGAYGWMKVIRTYDNAAAMYWPYGDEPNPGLLYQASFHCTLWIETYIANILSDRPLLDVSDLGKEYKTAAELQERIDELQTRIDHIREPEFPKDVDMYVSLTKWAKDQAEYMLLGDLESELADREDELEQLESEQADQETEQEQSSSVQYDPKNSVLYIYQRGNIICKKQKHELVDVNCIIPSVDGEIKINAQYCRDCDKFIISESSYRFYLNGFGFVPVRFRYVDDDGRFPQHLYKKERSSFSPLSLAGYNVRANNGLSNEERHDLLAFLIDHGIMNKYEVIGYLEMFANTNGQKRGMEKAVAKWENDAKYVRQYNMERQDTYQIDRVERY